MKQPQKASSRGLKKERFEQETLPYIHIYIHNALYNIYNVLLCYVYTVYMYAIMHILYIMYV